VLTDQQRAALREALALKEALRKLESETDKMRIDARALRDRYVKAVEACLPINQAFGYAVIRLDGALYVRQFDELHELRVEE